MGYIHCCSGLREAKQYSLRPEDDYLIAQIEYLEECPICGHTVIQITKIDKQNKVSVCRKINAKAKKMFNRLRNLIIAEKKTENISYKYYSNFYLYYNEYGVKKKCYSNLSTLKMGLFENKIIGLKTNV